MELLNKCGFQLMLYAWIVTSYSYARPSTQYMTLRENLIQEEKNASFGSAIQLSEDEIVADNCLMAAKLKEVDDGFANPSNFLPAKNFLDARSDIEKSEVFQILQKMPKGGLFHAHSKAISTLDFLVYNMTYHPDLYMCFKQKKMQFRFFKNPNTECKWELLEQLRETDPTIDARIKNYLMLRYESMPKDANGMWDQFESIFSIVSGLIKYRPIFEIYLYGALQDLYDDNVMFLELRTSMSKLYDINGTRYTPVEVAAVYQNVSKRFCEDHPNFMGIKLIYAPFRQMSLEAFDKHIEKYRTLKAAHPDLIIGFDLVGQEDKGQPLLSFADRLETLSKEMAFFFHAGETNWNGHSTDENLFDAVLLNSKRIGHGFALMKHPKLLELVKEKNIVIELNPISNQVLKLIDDMRNHPASYFFAENLPIVVSSDDPSLWGAKGLSYDFYETFVGIMSRDADLRALKQLALNSLTYSGLTAEEKLKAFDIFEKSWKTFVKDLASSEQCTNKQLL